MSLQNYDAQEADSKKLQNVTGSPVFAFFYSEEKSASVVCWPDMLQMVEVVTLTHQHMSMGTIFRFDFQKRDGFLTTWNGPTRCHHPKLIQLEETGVWEVNFYNLF